LESIKDLFKHRNFSKLHFGYKWLTHFRCASEFSGLYHTFLDETLSQNMAHIDDLPFLWDTQVTLGILSSHVICQSFYFIWTVPFPSSFLFLLVNMCGHYGSKVLGVYSGFLSEAPSSIPNLFWWYKPFIYGNLCFICFYKELNFGGFIYVF